MTMTQAARRTGEPPGSVLGASLTGPAGYRHRVSALIESPAFYPQLSGREHLRVPLPWLAS